MTAGDCCRTVRAAMFAALCVLLTALGHALMSGSPVPWWALGCGLVGTGATAWCLAGRERGFAQVVAVAVVAQVVLHELFSMAQTAARPPMGGPVPEQAMGAMGSTASMESMASMGSTGSLGSLGSVGSLGHMSHMGSMSHMGHMESMGSMSHGMSGMAGMHDMAGMPMSLSSFGMLAAHLLAALLCGLWLAYGERAAFRILRAVAGWLFAPLRLVLPRAVAPRRPSVRTRRDRTVQAPRQLFLVHAITSRGPPAGTAVV
ncbi:hypothetical protein ACFWXK_03635 [Streptomyces sp. NPDC059070]|uniref:hypothetical protein n=1 Tax=Streptomyces sp. NPDC059070 TaxID=3346713 RepID=UPI0036A1390F